MMSTTTTQSGVTGTGEWDSRLNRLLEDLQETVIPTDPTSRNAQEYREYHITKRTQINDEPPQTMDEKWVEIGNLVGGGPVGVSGGVPPSSKSVAFADEYDFKNNYASSSTKQSSSRTLTSTDHHQHNQRGSNMEFLAPANMTTELKSSPTSPTTSSSSPKIERKEFYTKASYTTMIKGEEPPSFPPITSPSLLSQTTAKHLDYNNESSSSYNKSSYMSSTTTDTNNRHQETHNIGSPLYTSTPMKQPQSPPHKADALKTPPMIRKILQQSSTQKDHHHHHHTHSNNMGTTTTQITKPPTGGVPLPIIQSSSSSSTHQMISTKTSSSQPKPIPSYDEPPERIGAKYYTSTVTTEHTRRGEREVSPIRRFPVQQQQQPPVEANPKRLDELLASFEDSSYMRSSTTTRTDGDGPHRSVPYGPGTTQVRSVRIHEDEVSNRRSAADDESSELLRKRNNTTVQNPTYNKDEVLMKNVAGPPVFYPPGNIFNNSQNGKGDEGGDSSVVGGKRKEKEKMKGKRSEKGGEGAVPVPVCLPVCCAAPCSIM